jgi:hypothetical protein
VDDVSERGGDGVSFPSQLKSSQTNIDSSGGASEGRVVHKASVARHHPAKNGFS